MSLFTATAEAVFIQGLVQNITSVCQHTASVCASALMSAALLSHVTPQGDEHKSDASLVVIPRLKPELNEAALLIHPLLLLCMRAFVFVVQCFSSERVCVVYAWSNLTL